MNRWWKRSLTSPVINYFGQRKALRFTKGPILIGGCARSGTSLMLAMLSAHPDIFALPRETDAFTGWGSQGAHPTRLDRFHRALLTSTVPASCRRWCEKRPYNVRFIQELLNYFGPEARFIHMVRDPRAVCTSMHPSRPGAYWVSPERYVQDVSAGWLFRDHPQVLTMKYEDLILEEQKALRILCDFLDEPPSDEILHWYEHARVRSHSAWPTGLTKRSTSSLYRWKAGEHKERVAQIMKHQGISRLMTQLGYG